VRNRSGILPLSESSGAETGLFLGAGPPHAAKDYPSSLKGEENGAAKDGKKREEGKKVEHETSVS